MPAISKAEIAQRELAVPRVVAAYQAGSPIRRLAAGQGWSYGFTRGRLLSAGVTLRPRGGGPRRKGQELAA